MSLVSGEFVKGVEPDSTQEDSYYFLSTDYTMLSFWKLPYFESNTRIILRASAQLADKPLSSINQFSIAGPTRARGCGFGPVHGI